MTKLYVCEISNLIKEIKADEKAIEVYFDKLEKGRMEHIMKHNKAEDRARILGVSLLLLFALEKAGIVLEKLPDFAYMENGKPYLESCPEVYFNLSHSMNIIACVISNAEVGVDIECVREIRDLTVQKVFSDRERKMAGGSKEEYVKLWTMKESFAKLLGTGLADIWSGMEICDGLDGRCVKKLNHDIRKTICGKVVADGCVFDLNKIPYYYSVCTKHMEHVEVIQTFWNEQITEC